MVSTKSASLKIKKFRCKITQCGGRCLRSKETCRLGTTPFQKKAWGSAVTSARSTSPRGADVAKAVAVGAVATVALTAGTGELVKYKINTDKDFEAFVSASISTGQENIQILAKKGGIEDVGQTMSDSLYRVERAKLSKEDLNRQEKITIERIAKTTLGAQQEIANGNKTQNKIPSDWKNFKATDQDRMNFLDQTLSDKDREAQTQTDLDKYYNVKEPLTPEELSALRHYTDPVGYREINATLRGDRKSKQSTMEFLKKRGDTRTEKEVEERAILESRLAASALNKMSDYKGKVYRGGNYPQDYIDGLTPGKTIQDKAFTSSTSSIVKKFPGNTQFIINSSNGKYISKYMNQSQEEVLFRPETKFVITDKKRVKIGGRITTVVYMNEKTIN